MASGLYDTILRQAQKLTPEELASLRKDLAILAGEQTFAPEAEHDSPPAADASEPRRPLRSLYGIVADLGPAPSAEEIDAMRREAWAGWPSDAF